MLCTSHGPWLCGLGFLFLGTSLRVVEVVDVGQAGIECRGESRARFQPRVDAVLEGHKHKFSS